ncbi:hypothetical protein Tcan_05481, partial [Toxocara canis]
LPNSCLIGPLTPCHSVASDSPRTLYDNLVSRSERAVRRCYGISEVDHRLQEAVTSIASVRRMLQRICETTQNAELKASVEEFQYDAERLSRKLNRLISPFANADEFSADNAIAAFPSRTKSDGKFWLFIAAILH